MRMSVDHEAFAHALAQVRQAKSEASPMRFQLSLIALADENGRLTASPVLLRSLEWPDFELSI